MPNNSSFDNRFVTVDLPYYPASPASQFYFGLGYTSYQLPTQLECLVLSPSEVPYLFFLIWFDTLYSAFMQVESIMNTGDRFGAGLSDISDEAKAWVEAANPGRQLYDSHQFTMMVDYSLTLGLRWTGDVCPARLGLGVGYSVGGQVIMAMSSSFQPISRVDQVEASPNLYLAHHGLIFKVSASW